MSIIHPDYEDDLINIKNKKLYSCLLKNTVANTSKTLGNTIESDKLFGTNKKSELIIESGVEIDKFIDVIRLTH